MPTHKLFSLIILSIIFAGCKGTGQQSSQPSDSLTKVSAAVIDSTGNLIKTFAPLINGIWVKKDYIEKVISTKSPLAATDMQSQITTMVIDTKKIKGDSLRVGCGTLHEGGDCVIKFRKGSRPSTIQLNSSDIGFETDGKDTTLILYKTHKNDPPTAKYVRAMKATFDSGLDDGFKFLMNKGLVSGTYVLKNDNNGQVKEVTFDNYGKLTGIPGFKTYFIDYDLNSGPMTNFDEIIFDLNSDHQDSYAFKINKDTLNLYQTISTSDTTEVLGKLKYKLVRKRK